MIKKSFTLIAALVLFVCVGQSHAAPAWMLDKAHSNIYFAVDHIFSETRGHFKDFKTDIHFDPKDLGSSQFFFEIQVDSIDTYIPKRDKHLQSADFFEVSKYPTITFKSEKIMDKGNQMYHVAGKLNIKDKEYDLTLPVKLVGVQDHPREKGKLVAGFDAEITIDRLAYNVGSGKFYDMGLIGKEVEILVSLELLKDK